MSGGSFNYRQPVKVVIINTQYVETDATSFKSVVQNLTGKDSKITVGGGGDMSAFSNKRAAAAGGEIRAAGGGGGDGGYKSILSRGVSFKDFDRLLMELPPLDELYRLIKD